MFGFFALLVFIGLVMLVRSRNPHLNFGQASGQIIGKGILGIFVLGLALVFWPVTIILLVLGGGFKLAGLGTQEKGINQYGWKPVRKRPIWQASDTGWWYTTDGHPSDPGVIGPCRTREIARQYAEEGQNFLMDSEGLFSIPY